MGEAKTMTIELTANPTELFDRLDKQGLSKLSEVIGTEVLHIFLSGKVNFRDGLRLDALAGISVVTPAPIEESDDG